MIRGIARATTRKQSTQAHYTTLVRSRISTTATRVIPVSLQQQPATSPLHKPWLLAAGLTLTFGGLTVATLQEKVYALEATSK